jgi:hypothetical protein
MLLCVASCSSLRLDAWSQLPDGRVTGMLGDRTVWLNVAAQSRAATGTHAAPPCYVETISGTRYELGERRPSRVDSGEAPSRAWAWLRQPAAAWIRQPASWHEDLPLKLASVAGAAVLVQLSGLGLAAGTHAVQGGVGAHASAAASQACFPGGMEFAATAVAAAAMEFAATTSSAAAAVAGQALKPGPGEGAAVIEQLVAAAAAEQTATTTSAAAALLAQVSSGCPYLAQLP